MAPQGAGEWGSGVAFSLAIVGAAPTPPGCGCVGRRDVGVSRGPVPFGGACECGMRARPGASGQTVTCSGNVPNGFQAGGGVDNLTVNVLPGR